MFINEKATHDFRDLGVVRRGQINNFWGLMFEAHTILKKTLCENVQGNFQKFPKIRCITVFINPRQLESHSLYIHRLQLPPPLTP